MSINKLDKYEIRRRALLEAIRFCGGVVAYSDCIKVSRTRASNWRNQPEISIPYEYVVLTEDITRVSIERLSPFTEAANKAIRRLRDAGKLPPIEVSLNEIIVNDYLEYKDLHDERQIIVGTDRVLISGLTSLESKKSLKLKKAIVTVLDLESMLLGMSPPIDMNLNFLISEQVAVGLRLEQLMGSLKEKYNQSKNFSSSKINIQPRRICDEVQDGHKNKIVHILGLDNNNNYHLAKQVYLYGISEVISMLDKKQISIALATEIAKLSKASQCEQIEKIEHG